MPADVARPLGRRRHAEARALSAWIKPQLTKLVDQPPNGSEWLHELKFDGYRMHARLDRGAVRLLTRTGLDWTPKYPTIAAATASLPARQAYLVGEMCEVRPDGTTSFSLVQNASDTGNAEALVLFPGRSPPPRWQSDRPDAAYGAQGTPPRPAFGRKLAPGFQRSPDRARASLLRPRLRPESGRDRLETGRCALRSGQSRAVAQSEMSEPRGVQSSSHDQSVARSGRIDCRLFCATCWS